jgi:hypothetical protein
MNIFRSLRPFLRDNTQKIDNNWIPIVVIQPNVNWGVQKEKLMEVKEEVVKLGMTQ